PDGGGWAWCGGPRQGNEPGELKVWDLATGKEVLALQGHSSLVERVAFSPDGRHLASTSQDRTIMLWNAVTGLAEHTLIGHTSRPCSLAFSPDGTRLVSAGELLDPSGTAFVAGEWRVWDPATGKEVLALRGHGATILSVAFSP